MSFKFKIELLVVLWLVIYTCHMTKIPASLRDNHIWKDTYEIAQYVYVKLEELADNYPDEKWSTVIKLRSSAVDSIFYVSQAVGSMESDATIYDWNNARKNLFALQTIYLFVTKQKMLDIEPDLIVKIDKLISRIGTVAAAGINNVC